MPRSLNRTLSFMLATVWLAGTAAVAQAQATAPAAKPAAPAAKASAPAAKPAKKPAKAAPKAPPPEVPPPAADAEQLKAAAMTHIGAYQCEMNQAVEVTTNPKYEGYVDVSFKKSKYTMKPVLSSTGALRLEDVKGQTLMLQIAHKSMLMDVKAGQRLVDECMHEKQAAAKKAAEGQASQGLMGN
jgi:hypothetical protein